MTIATTGLNKPLGLISRSTFPLPTLEAELDSLAKELHTGRGFFVLRAIPVSSYSREENLIIYVGVSSYIANLRGVQDAPYGVLSHVTDLRRTHSAEGLGAPAYTTDKQVYHTDSGDIVALFALETGAKGGTSRICSAWNMYNEIAKTRPDLIKVLSEPWPFDG